MPGLTLSEDSEALRIINLEEGCILLHVYYLRNIIKRFILLLTQHKSDVKEPVRSVGLTIKLCVDLLSVILSCNNVAIVVSTVCFCTRFTVRRTGTFTKRN